MRDFSGIENRSEPLGLRAGHLTMWFEPDSGFVRRVCAGGTEVVRAVYGAVRDRNWGTVPTRVSLIEQDVRQDSFRIQFDARGEQEGVLFLWRGTLEGTARGEVSYRFEGEARAVFLKNRIGLCVLCPAHCAGKLAVASDPQGRRLERPFPSLIEPQIVGRPPFGPLRSLEYEFAPPRRAYIRFEGDIFEMEDQRNWTDASFKIYSTPLAEPFPVKVEAGTRVLQEIVIRADASSETISPRISAEDVVELKLEGLSGVRVPELGLQWADEHHDAEALRHIAQLGLSHVRVDVNLGQPGWESRFIAAQELGVAPLETVLHLPPGAVDDALGRLRACLKPGKVKRFLVFGAGEPATTLESLRLARKHLGSLGIPIGGGTDSHFCELNREQSLGRSQPGHCDCVAWPVTPQVHTFDNLSIIENLEAQAATLETARSFCSGRPLCITPVTLKPRFNAVATSEATPAGDKLPPNVDPRQSSLFLAAWTLGSLLELAKAGASSITFFETVGWRGVLERAQGSPMPDLFPSRPGMLFPVFHVLRWVAGYDLLKPLHLTPPFAGTGMVLSTANGTGSQRLLVADLSGKGLRFRLNRNQSFIAAEGIQSPTHPAPEPVTPRANGLWELGPYSILRLDLA